MSTLLISGQAWARWGAALSLVGVLGSAQAALFEDDDARRAILDLRQRLEQVNKSLSEENAQLRRSLLDFQAQLDALKADVSQGRGAQERLARDVSDVQLRQKDIQSGVDERLRRFEPLKVSVDGREFMADPAEKREFDASMEIFRKGDFAAAQNALGQFVQRYGQSGYLPSALFWLGNAQYATKAYKESLGTFQRMLNDAPGHPRAPEALLAISNVQIELKDVKAARKTLEDLIKAYPGSETAATARDRLARLR
ncbi:tol-pal system protein YbgF [Limnohabitans sp. T6-5]|uniref:tol-pal system protein YbgF n=1 Tax=Limnohabitans sp. T6-5 TaxID=1100724 RepID=UPI000D38AAB8|nr:tol-pal system protein YbgF [Limnohabitans sp. T6-5]PUE09556.1 tol-pal system protein YbgF [Limnohabitans sp. T6-5]